MQAPALAPWRLSRAAPSPTPTSSAWSATTGCGRRSGRPRPEIAAADPRRPGRASWTSPRACTTGGWRRRGRSASATLLVDRHRRLGPRAAARGRRARRRRATACRPHFLDNTDPDGFDRVLGGLGAALAETLCRRDLQVRRHRRDPQRHARGRGGLPRRGSRLRPTRWRSPGQAARSTAQARDAGLPRAVPDVGLGRRPHLGDERGGAAARGAAGDRHRTRSSPGRRPWTRPPAATRSDENPAALLALAWHAAGEGRGAKAMVVLPYKDRLLLFSRYLQQLVMESIGKEKDLAGRVVHQGLDGLRQQGLDRPARLRPAAARRDRRTSS